jgi:hypothetical protein
LQAAHKSKREQEISSPDLHPEEADDDVSQEVAFQKVQFSGIEKIGVPYKVHSFKADSNSTFRVSSSLHGFVIRATNFHFQENRQLQSRLLEELVNEEGPIHFDYAVQRLVSAWGLKRRSPKIVQAVREALNLLILKQKVVVKGSFLWPQQLQDVPVRIPILGVPESKRKLGYIPPEEIENAMKTIAQYALGISPESLINETAKVFGFTRLGEKSKKRFSDIYKRLLWEKKLVCNHDLVNVA